MRRCSKTSLSILFKVASSIPSALATLFMSRPKDLRSSKKSISSPVTEIVNPKILLRIRVEFTCEGIMKFWAGDVALRPATRVHVSLGARGLSHLDAPLRQTLPSPGLREVSHRARLLLVSQSQPPLRLLLSRNKSLLPASLLPP